VVAAILMIQKDRTISGSFGKALGRLVKASLRR